MNRTIVSNKFSDVDISINSNENNLISSFDSNQTKIIGNKLNQWESKFVNINMLLKEK